MRRREFLGVLSGTAITWPFAAGAQQPDQMRNIGLLVAGAADDPEHQGRIRAFQKQLEQLGWIDGRNARIDIRWATTNSDIRKHAAELAAQAPDVILAATGTATVAPLLDATRIVPIVFVLLIDPVGAGLQAWHGRAETPPASSCSNMA
jgi:putative ABC transport system substrate-binding protein